jgi:hypothetical protein
MLLLASGCGSSPAPPSPPVPRAKQARAFAMPAQPAPGVHGSALVSTKALPSRRELRQDRQTVVTATTALGFAVTIENSGEWPESNVHVTLTIAQMPNPIVRAWLVGRIQPGERRTIVFRNLGQVMFATRLRLKVDIQPVPGETNTANNFAQFPVVFSLG